MTQEHPIRMAPKTLWPELIVDIADVIGDETALTFFIKLNGRRFKVPCKLREGNVIALAIGMEKGEVFCKHFQGENLIIPKCSFVLRRLRNINIIADSKAGMTESDLATKYDLTYRQISTIVNGQKEKPHV